MEPRARFVPNPPFLCAPVSRDRAFFFPFFFFFFFSYSIDSKGLFCYQGRRSFFFRLNFIEQRIERVTDQIDQQNLSFFLPLFFFPRIPSIRKDRSIREGDLFFFFFSPNFIYYIIVIILFVIISSR